MVLATLAIPAKLPRQMRPRRQPQLERKRISDIIIRKKGQYRTTQQDAEFKHCRAGELEKLAGAVLVYEVAPAVLVAEAAGEVEGEYGPGEYDGEAEFPTCAVFGGCGDGAGGGGVLETRGRCCGGEGRRGTVVVVAGGEVISIGRRGRR